MAFLKSKLFKNERREKYEQPEFNLFSEKFAHLRDSR